MGRALLWLFVCIQVLLVVGWNPNLKYFGFYTYNHTDYDFMPYANLYESANLDTLIAAHAKGLHGLWFVQDIFFQPNFQLRSDYLSSWQNASTLVRPLLTNGTVLGFMMGDELINNGVSWENLDLTVSLVRKTFPTSIIYTNEAFVTFTGNNEFYPQVPVDLDWVSIDFYPVWGTFQTLKSIYFNQIYPKMSPNQKVMYVSGVYATTVNPEFYCGNSHCEEVMIAWNLQALEWAKTDDRFVGIFPWHFDTFNTTFLPGFEIGLDELPQLQQAISHIATQITTGQPTPDVAVLSGGICGLSAGTSTSTSLCGDVSPVDGCPDGFEQQSWLIGNTGEGDMTFCASSQSTNLPTGGICFNMGGDVIPCGGYDPYIACPEGYFEQVWSVAWGTTRMFFCEKTNSTIPDATGTICGMVTNGGSTGVMCGGVNPYNSCPTGYASASWEVNFGNGLWSACFRI